MKRIKLSNTFFLTVAFFSLVLALGTGCGGSSSSSSNDGTPADPGEPPIGEPEEPPAPPQNGAETELRKAS